MSTNNNKISVLLYSMNKNKREVSMEISCETKDKLYQLIADRNGYVIYMVNCGEVARLPKTPNTKVLLKTFEDNKILIMNILELANTEWDSQNFRIAYNKLQDILKGWSL